MNHLKLHYIFICELLFISKRYSRHEPTKGFSRLLTALKLTYRWVKDELFLDGSQIVVANLVSKYCSPPHSGIALVANYGLDYRHLLRGNTVCPVALCFGLHDNASYEESLVLDFGLRVYAFDPTPISQTKYGGRTDADGFYYLPYALWTSSGRFPLYLRGSSKSAGGSLIPTNVSEENVAVECYSLDSMLQKLSLSSVSILKLDIDGGEIEIVTALLDNWLPSYPSQIAMELDVGESEDIAKIQDFLQKMHSKFNIYYIPHKRRYCHLELLFVERSSDQL
jgi:FkbM family methyltransferase